MDRPAKLIDRYRQWAYDMREGFRALSTDEDYRYWFDPYWVRAEPYRTTLKSGEATEVVINVRNFRKKNQVHRIEIHTPPGIVAEPAVLEGTLHNETRKGFPIRLRSNDAVPGLKIIALDITLDGRRYGELFDFMIDVIGDDKKLIGKSK